MEKIARAMRKKQEAAQDRSSRLASSVVAEGGNPGESNGNDDDDDDYDDDDDDDGVDFAASVLAEAQEGRLASGANEKGGKKNSTPAPAFFSTHPSNAARREKLKERLPLALALYKNIAACPMLPYEAPSIPRPRRNFLRANKIKNWDEI